MFTRPKWIISLLGVLLIAAFAGFLWTRPAEDRRLFNRSPAALSQPAKLVDETPLETANSLAPLSSAAQEQDMATEAIRLADHEVDLAFATALRQAQEASPPHNGAIKPLFDRVQFLESRLQEQQQLVSKLTGQARENNSAQRQLEIAQARVTLLQDALEDAKEDLLRAGGDPQGEINRELEQHEAVQHKKSVASSAKPSILSVRGDLLSQFREWRSLRETRQRLLEAQGDATAAADRLTHKHEALEKGLPDSLPDSTQDDSSPIDQAQQAATLSNLHSLSDRSKSLAAYDKRIEAQQGLAKIYGQWAEIVELQIRIALHAILRSLLWIILALIGIVFAEMLVERFFVGLGPDRRRLGTMRLVLRFVAQSIGLLVIILVLLGPPTQLSTVLALAGAGLTVALKDFIVAFFGWFMLMGREGIRRGDWVEIEGIGGEVVDVGLLRTTLLETGNWNDAGHPTGRKVSFVNSFAIERHYFNFTTAGQWLWDELDVLIPSGEDPYNLTNSVLKLVTDETREDAEAAEQEWRNATHDSAVKSFSASPAINVRPTNLGVNLVIRYVVNAHNRYPVRTRLYQAIVELLHRKTPNAAESAPAR